MKHLHVKKGDNVTILTGKDKGKQGEIISAHPREGKVVVEGVNRARKHVRGKGIIEIARPIHVSNVAKVVSAQKKTKAPAKKKAVTKKKKA